MTISTKIQIFVADDSKMDSAYLKFILDGSPNKELISLHQNEMRVGAKIA